MWYIQYPKDVCCFSCNNKTDNHVLTIDISRLHGQRVVVEIDRVMLWVSRERWKKIYEWMRKYDLNLVNLRLSFSCWPTLIDDCPGNLFHRHKKSQARWWQMIDEKSQPKLDSIKFRLMKNDETSKFWSIISVLLSCNATSSSDRVDTASVVSWVNSSNLIYLSRVFNLSTGIVHNTHVLRRGKRQQILKIESQR